jgi:hypothetical protein
LRHEVFGLKEVFMSKGWREVARLGGTGARYPHVLADAQGWCLRLGPKSRTDEKYYSSLPLLLHGLVQHAARRRLMALSASLDLQELCREVRDALHAALGLCREVLEKGGLEEHIRRAGAPGEGPVISRSSLRHSAGKRGEHEEFSSLLGKSAS